LTQCVCIAKTGEVLKVGMIGFYDTVIEWVMEVGSDGTWDAVIRM
jgi:hypothetical protein